jgi:hypothetical protein
MLDLTMPTVRDRRPFWRGGSTQKIVRASNVHAHAKRTKQNSANRRTKQNSANSLDQFWGALDEEEFAGGRLGSSTTRTTDKVSDKEVSYRRRRDKQFSSQTQNTAVSVSEDFDEELVALAKTPFIYCDEESDEKLDEDRTPPVRFVKTPGAPTTMETSRLVESDENSLIESDEKNSLIESDENSLIDSDDYFEEDRTPTVSSVKTPGVPTTKETSRLIGSNEKSDEKKAPRKWGFLSRLRKNKGR